MRMRVFLRSLKSIFGFYILTSISLSAHAQNATLTPCQVMSYCAGATVASSAIGEQRGNQQVAQFYIGLGTKLMNAVQSCLQNGGITTKESGRMMDLGSQMVYAPNSDGSVKERLASCINVAQKLPRS